MFNTNIELMEKALRVSNQKMEIRKRGLQLFLRKDTVLTKRINQKI